MGEAKAQSQSQSPGLLSKLKGFVWGSGNTPAKKVTDLSAQDEQKSKFGSADAVSASIPTGVTVKGVPIVNLSQAQLIAKLADLNLPTSGSRPTLEKRLTKAILALQKVLGDSDEEEGETIDRSASLKPAANGNTDLGADSNSSRSIQQNQSSLNGKPKTSKPEDIQEEAKQEQDVDNKLGFISSKKKTISRDEYDRLKKMLQAGIRSKASPKSNENENQNGTIQKKEDETPKATPIDVVRMLTHKGRHTSNIKGGYKLSAKQPTSYINSTESSAFRAPVRYSEEHENDPKENSPKASPVYAPPGSDRLKRRMIGNESAAKRYKAADNSLLSTPAYRDSPFAPHHGFSADRNRRSPSRDYPSPDSKFNKSMSIFGGTPAYNRPETTTQRRRRPRHSTSSYVSDRSRSDVAQRILETLGKMSTPLEDVRKRKPPSWATPSLALEARTKRSVKRGYQTMAPPSASLELQPRVPNRTPKMVFNAELEKGRNNTRANGSMAEGEKKKTSAIPAIKKLKQHLDKPKNDREVTEPIQTKSLWDKPSLDSSSSPLMPAAAPPTFSSASVPAFGLGGAASSTGISSGDGAVSGFSFSNPISVSSSSNQPTASDLLDPRFVFTSPPGASVPAEYTEFAIVSEVAKDSALLSQFSFGSSSAPPRKKPNTSKTPAKMKVSKKLPLSLSANVSSSSDIASTSAAQPVGISFSMQQNKAEDTKSSLPLPPPSSLIGDESKAAVDPNDFLITQKAASDKDTEKLNGTSTADEPKGEVSALFKKFLKNNQTWKCDKCLTNQNPLDVDKCQCCEAPRPGAKAVVEEKPGPKLSASMFASSSTTSKPDSKPAMAFNFGSKPETDSSKSEAPKFNFGAPATDDKAAKSAGSGFSFGTPAADKAAESKSTGFSFGAPAPAADKAAESKSTGFSFGSNKPKESNEDSSSGGFNFGASTSDSKPEEKTTATTGFSFGAPPSTSISEEKEKEKKPEAASTGFSFGAASKASEEPKSAGFSFGTSAASTVADSAKEEEKKQTTSSAGFSFGSAETKKAETSSGFQFGGSSTNQKDNEKPASASTLSVGTGDAASGGMFSSTSASSSSTGFKFGDASDTSKVQKAPASSGFKFGASDAGEEKKEETKPFSFGGNNKTEESKPEASTPAFSFGASSGNADKKTETKGFSFGTSAQPDAGEKKSEPASTSSGFSFGSTINKSESSATTTQQNSNTAFSFGSSTNSASASASTGPFGSSSTKTNDASSSGAPFKFGAASSSTGNSATNLTAAPSAAANPFSNAQTSVGNPFGGGDSSKASTNNFTFGASSGSNANPTSSTTPAFGQGAASNTATPFGASSSAPSTGGGQFGATSTNTGGFSFGASSNNNTGAGNVFGAGNNNSMGNNKPFGGGNSNNNNTAFGGASNTPFGGANNASNTPFGGANNASNTPFGGANNNNSGGFGQSNPQQQQSANPFGANNNSFNSNPMGMNQTPQVSNPFGGGGMSAGNPFGGGAAAPGGGGFSIGTGGVKQKTRKKVRARRRK